MLLFSSSYPSEAIYPLDSTTQRSNQGMGGGGHHCLITTSKILSPYRERLSDVSLVFLIIVTSVALINKLFRV